jgi:hypothetical protein
MDLVEVMAIARLRLRRFLAIESNLFHTEIVRREKQIDAKLTNMDQDARLAWVFQHMADNGQSIAMLMRYEGSINRSYDKALKQLLLLQSRRLTPPPSPPLEARPSGRAQLETRPWVRSVLSDSPDRGAGPCPANEPRPLEARPSGRAPSETRPSDVGPGILPASRLSGRLSSTELQPSATAPPSPHPPLDPKPAKTPIQPKKPTSNVNPTIPVRDSVS